MKDQNDIIQRFMLESLPVRGAVVNLTGGLATLYEGHQYTPDEQLLIAECVMANVLMTSHLKIEGLVSIQAKGEGNVRLLTSDCDNNFRYRGLLESSHEFSDEKALLENLMLTMTLEPAKGQRYQSIVPVDSGSLAKAFEAYFDQSEQLPTLFRFVSNGDKAIGLMLQLLPEERERADDWEHIRVLLNTLMDEEMLTLSFDEWLYRLFHQEGVRLYDERPVHFGCSCSREGYERALISLGKQEIDSIIEEQGSVETQCHFCHQVYLFDAQDVTELFSSGSDKASH